MDDVKVGAGKGWIGSVLDERVQFLQKELQNGGRALSFEKLAKMAQKEVPGGIPTTQRLVKRVCYAVQNGINLKDRNDAFDVKLPTGGGMRRWLAEREIQRQQHAGAEVKECKRGHLRTPENTNKNGACKMCNKLMTQSLEKRRLKALNKPKRKYKKRKMMNPLIAITAAQESSLDNIRSSIADLPEELQELLGQVKESMVKHQYRKVEVDDQGEVVLEPVVQKVYTKLHDK